MKQPVVINSFNEAQGIVLDALKKKNIRTLAYVGQRASDYLMFKDIVPIGAVICLDYGKDAQVIEKNIPLVSLEKKDGVRRQWYSDKIAELFNDPVTKSQIQNILPPGSGILPYSSTPALESMAALNNWQILSALSSVRDGAEDKINVLGLKQDLGLPNCNTLVNTPDDLCFSCLEKVFGEKFVVQTAGGSSGSGTHIVTTKETWKEVRKTTGIQPLLMAPFLKGPVISINMVITPRQVITLPPAVTVIGNDETAPGKTVFSGVDFSAINDVPPDLISSIQASAQKVGTYLRSKGYLGAVNLDFLGEYGGVLTDINARLMGSGPLTAETQLMVGEIPFTLIHLLTFLGIDFVIAQEVVERIAAPKQGAFIVLHSLEGKDAVVGNDVPLGYYTPDAEFVREGLEYKYTKENEVLVGSAIPQKGKTVEPGSPLLRIFSQERVLGPNFLLTPTYSSFCKKIYSRLELQ